MAPPIAPAPPVITVTLSLRENLSTIFGDKLNGLVGTMMFGSDSGLINEVKDMMIYKKDEMGII